MIKRLKKYLQEKGIIARNRVSPFAIDFLPTDSTFEFLYNSCLLNESEADYYVRREEIFKKINIEVEERLERQDEKEGRRVTINGNKISGHVTEMALIGGNKIIVSLASRPYRNIQAYSIEGKLLWEIEPIQDIDGNNVYSFGSISGVKKGLDGREMLIVSWWPHAWATDLETGKGTYLCAVYDDTNMK